MRRGRRLEAAYAIGSKHVGSSYERPFERSSRRLSCSGGFCVSSRPASVPFYRLDCVHTPWSITSSNIARFRPPALPGMRRNLQVRFGSKSVASWLSASDVYRKQPTIALLDLRNDHIASLANNRRVVDRRGDRGCRDVTIRERRGDEVVVKNVRRCD